MGSAVSRFVPKKEVLWTEEDERKVARIQSLWLSFDIDFDGNISLSEMAVHMQKNGKRVDMQSLKLAFDLVDKDRSGRISFCEFCKFNGLRASNEKLREISEQTRQLYNAKLAKMVTASSWSPSNGPTKHIVHVILLSLEFSEQSDVQRFDPEEFDRLYEVMTVESSARSRNLVEALSPELDHRPGWHQKLLLPGSSVQVIHGDEHQTIRRDLLTLTKPRKGGPGGDPCSETMVLRGLCTPPPDAGTPQEAPTATDLKRRQ